MKKLKISYNAKGKNSRIFNKICERRELRARIETIAFVNIYDRYVNKNIFVNGRDLYEME